MRQMTDTENQMNGVERMLEYRDRIEHEVSPVGIGRALREHPGEGFLHCFYCPTAPPPPPPSAVRCTVNPLVRTGHTGWIHTGVRMPLALRFRV